MNAIARTYVCMCCHTEHQYSLYMLTHLADRPHHICDTCGAVHVLSEGEAEMVKEGELLSPWFSPDYPPHTEGYYRIMMPAGNVPEKHWWWTPATQKFHYEPGSPATICLTSIKAWRGLALFIPHPNNPLS